MLYMLKTSPIQCVILTMNVTSNVDRYTLTNKHKAIVRLISWGASIQSIKVPNRDGKLADVVLGFDDMDGEFVC